MWISLSTRITSFVSGLVLLLCMFPVSSMQNNNSVSELQAQLFTAAEQDNAELTRKLIDDEIDIDFKDKKGRTALLVATHHNSINAARVLIEAGADVNAMDNISDSPYLYAGAEGRLEILRMTLEHGADLTSVNRYGGTALIPAAHHGHVETVRKLLSTETDINHVNNLGWTALMEAIILGDGSDTYIQIVQLLVNAGADVNIPDGNGVTPLAHAIDRKYIEIIELLRRVRAK